MLVNPITQQPLSLPMPQPNLITPGLKAITQLPQGLQAQVLTKVMNTAFAVPLAEDEFDFLAGRTIRIGLRDLNANWFVSLNENNQLLVRLSGKEDASIEGDWLAFLKMATHYCDPDTLFFQRQLSISGDTELGLHVKNLLDSLEIDTLPKPLARSLTLSHHYLTKLAL
ncbi:ubiquinone anaerobic biosynthesis accessory factor UbiT [Salinivibrio siamensis]|nr:SCP2 sterol-binding domain-containing protein [Salinivibrio siamensis]